MPHGTVPILAGIDLHSGHIHSNVEEQHRSVEFIALLKQLDEPYPPEANTNADRLKMNRDR